MKKVIIAILAIGIISRGCEEEVNPNEGHTFTVECLPTNLQKDVIAFYPFGDGSLEDIGANAHSLNNNTSAQPTEDRNGNSKCAYIFDNAQSNSEFLTSTDSDFLNDLSEFSISVWYEPLNSSVMGQNVQGMFSRGSETRCPDRMGEWSMGLYDCRRAVFGHNNSVWSNSLTNFVSDCEGEVLAQIDTWHHVVGIKNGNDYKIYYDGVLHSSDSGDANCGNFEGAQNIGDIFVGYGFTGRIDDIIVYNREISQLEVEELFELEPCCE